MRGCRNSLPLPHGVLVPKNVWSRSHGMRYQAGFPPIHCSADKSSSQASVSQYVFVFDWHDVIQNHTTDTEGYGVIDAERTRFFRRYPLTPNRQSLHRFNVQAAFETQAYSNLTSVIDSNHLASAIFSARMMCGAIWLSVNRDSSSVEPPLHEKTLLPAPRILGEDYHWVHPISGRSGAVVVTDSCI